jgi:hypothetical protein
MAGFSGRLLCREGRNREEVYGWVNRALVEQGYSQVGSGDRGRCAGTWRR